MKNSYLRGIQNFLILVLFFCYASSKAQEGRLPTKEELDIKMQLQEKYKAALNNRDSEEPQLQFHTSNSTAPKKKENSAKVINPNHLLTTGPEQNCANAIAVCQQSYSQANSYSGFGSQEVNSSTCLSSRETNSVWYTFTVQNSGTFTFLLNTTNDYDFALYDISSIGCAGVPSATPVRCNYSSTWGNTGLTLPASATIPLSVGAGGSPTMPGLNVTAGQTFALIIDNFSANTNGYTLTFGGTAQIFDNTPPSLGTLIYNCSNSLTLNFSEPVKCSSIAANGSDFIITGPGAVNVPVTSAAGNLCSTGAANSNFATINFNTAGLTTGTYTVSVNTGTDGNTITDKCGNVMSTSLTATFQYLAPISISASSLTVCAGDPTTLTIIGVGGAAGATYSWTPTAGSNDNITVNPSATTTYVATVNYGGCSRTVSQVITIVQPPVVFVNPATASLCSGTTNIVASATMNGVACPNCNYVWTGTASQTDNGVANSTITNAGPGTYNVSVSSSGGCAGNTAVSNISILSPTSPPSCNIIYVSPAGGGTGVTPGSPTTIQTALTMAACNNITIKMQIGDYTISNPLSIGSYVTIEGGYNVGFTLKTSGKATAGGFPAQGTRIIRNTSNPEGIAGNLRLTALNVTAGSSNFRFQDLMILVNNAAAGTKTSNYAIYLGSASHDYDIVRCLLDAGKGSAGTTGTVGTNGNPGSPGSQPTTPFTTGPAGGAGANAGGAGGNGSTGGNNNTAGANGAGPAFGTGGARAAGGDRSDCDGYLDLDFPACNGSVGTNGGAGIAGAAGAAGAASTFAGGYFSIGGDGTVGSAGTGGSGGGGGGGGNKNTSACDGPTNGAAGSSGGGGGFAGNGGNGGTAAGAAFGVFSVNKGVNANVVDCNIAALVGTPGAGGNGGNGGNGGTGAAGGAITTGTFPFDQDGGAGGKGGNGGKGGDGGIGGAGATGQTCQVCDLNGASLTITPFVNFALAAQPVIQVDNVACTNININHSTAAGAPAWSSFGSGSAPASGAGSPVGTQYSTLGRKDLVMNANTYTGFNNIIVPSPGTGNILASATSICPGSIHFASSVAGTSGLTYVWSVSPAATIGTATLDSTGITFANGGTTPITYTVTLTITSQCCGVLTPVTKIITVYPIPAAPTASAAPTCMGGSATYTATAPSGVTFSWYNAASGGALLGTGNTYTASNVTSTNTVYVQASNSGGCLSSIVPVSVTPTAIQPPTPVSATSCDIGNVVVSINPAAGVSNYSWYSDAAGTILVQTGSLLTYGQNIGVAGGSYTVYVQSIVAGCNPSSLVPVTGSVSNTPITVTPAISPNDTVCINTPVTITLTPGGGNGSFTYAWSPVSGSTNTITQTVTASTSYSAVISSGGCSKTFYFPILVKAFPIATVAAPSSITCTTLSVVLDGSGSASGSDITYNWTTSGGTITSGGTTNSATVSAAGTYTLTVTDNTTGCASTSSVTVAANNTPPTAQIAAPSQLTCTNTSISLDGSLSSSSGSIVYNWTTTGGNIVSGGNTNTATVDQTGTYTLTVTDNSNSCSSTAPVTVTSNIAVPTVFAGADTIITCTNASLTLNSSSTTLGVTYSWAGTGITSGSGTANPTVNAAGTYTVTATDPSNGCTATDQIVVTSNTTVPNVNAGADTATTCTATTLVLNGSSTTTGVSYSWSGPGISSGSTTANPTVNATGTYTLTVTDPTDGCTAIDQVVVSNNAVSPNVNAGADTTLTCTTSSIVLNGSSTTSGVTYSWSGPGIVSGGATATPTINTAGTYTLTVTVGTCSSTDQVIVANSAAAPNVNAGADTTLSCTTISLVLNGSSTTSGVTYSWSGPGIVSGGATATPTINAVGTYTLTVTSGSCSSIDQIIVSNNNTPPNANAGADTILTCTTSSIVLNGSSTTSGVTYSWSGPGIVSGGATATPTINAAGTYIITVTSGICSTTDQLTVTSNTTAPNANAGADKTLTCSITSLSLSGSSTTIGATYSWSGAGITSGGSSATPTVNAAGTYTVTVTDPTNGCTATDQAVVNSNTTPPNANAGADATISCSATSLPLSGSSTTAGVTYSWSGAGITSGSNTATPTVNAAGTYTVTVTNSSNGCTATDNVVISPAPLPVASFSSNPASGTPPLTVTFSNSSQNANTYSWIFGNGHSSTATSPTDIYTTPGTYNVILVASDNSLCPDTARATIIVFDNFSLVIPNIFTPNGDGDNDLFKVTSTGVVEIKAEIFDRWGLKVGEWNNLNDGWNGQSKSGAKASDGTYYYIINIKSADQTDHVYTGYLQLLR